MFVEVKEAVFGWISQTQQSQQTSQSERDGEAPINTATTRPNQPTQHKAYYPMANRIERDQDIGCRSEGSHFGSMSQAQQSRQASQRKKYEDVPLSIKTARARTTQSA